MDGLKKNAFWLVILLVAAAGWKTALLAAQVVPFNADEAVVGLMARHILAGERPIFFYGQAYMGSLDAFLAAGGFALFGQQVWVIRLVQILLYLGTIITTVALGVLAFRSWKTGLLAGLLLTVPTVNMTLYTTASLGGYGEALLLGNLILLTAVAVRRRREVGRPTGWMIVLWGGIAGVGLWANALTLVYALPSGIYLLFSPRLPRREDGSISLLAFIRRVKDLLPALPAFALGALPWGLYALQNGAAQLLSELTGSAVAVEHAPWILRVVGHLTNLLLLGVTAVFGFRPPWAVVWLGLPLLPFVLLFWAGVIGFWARQSSASQPFYAEYRLLSGVVLTLSVAFIATSFGVDPSGRYFLPVTIPLVLAAAEMVQSIQWGGRWRYALLALVLGYQAWGTVQLAQRFPPGLTTQFYAPSIVDHRYDAELIRFLDAQGETRGYSNYWVSYPLAFLSDERLIFTPRLPYHPDFRYTARDDRYPPYAEQVERSQRIAYITTAGVPQVTEHLRSELKRLGVSSSEQVIGDYHVFYGLSRVVRPAEMDWSERP